MKKVHHMVSHMVDASVSLEGLDPANYGEGVVEDLWAKFLAKRNVSLHLLDQFVYYFVYYNLCNLMITWHMLGVCIPVHLNHKTINKIAYNRNKSYFRLLW